MKKTIKKLLLVFLTFVLVLAGSLVLLGVQDYKKLIKEEPINQKVSQIISDDDFVSFSELPQMLKDATVVTEDIRLYQRRSPLDFKAIARAMVRNVTSFSLIEGGSTIPQQVAKNMYFNNSASLQRKISEYLIAKDLLEDYGVDEILTLYLNIIYYGDGHYGIGQASHGYFDKAASDLSDYEATLLAGLPQAPSIYHLSGNYEGARKRQEHVLKRLVESEVLSEAEATQIYNQGGTYEKEND